MEAEVDICRSCILGKMAKKIFKYSFAPTSFAGEVVLFDLSRNFLYLFQEHDTLATLLVNTQDTQG